MIRRYIDQQRASVRIETREGEDAKPKIVGVAAVFYDGTPATEYVLWDDQWGRAVERIMPGAFDTVISGKQDVRGLFNHDSDNVLGRTSSGTMRISVDSVGLNYEVDPGDTTVSHDVMEHLKRKDVTGSSFSFSIPPAGQKWTITSDENGRTNEIREILAVDPLYDVGPVTFPAYDATAAGVRSLSDVKELRAQRLTVANVASQRATTPGLDGMRLELAEKGRGLKSFPDFN